jgi:site-specific recombinase XerD
MDDQHRQNPEKAEGYAEETVTQRSYRLDKFYRWVWSHEDGYTVEIQPEHAEEYMRHLAMQDYSLSYKSALQKAIKMLFRWRNFQHGTDFDWEPEITFSDDSGTHNPRDFITEIERRKIREASLEHGSVPHYSSVTPEERDEWKAYLAQRFGKPKEEVGLDDWERANGYKVPALINTSLDAGLRPVKVGRAKVSWLDLENDVLRIPKQDSSKNENNWIVGLQDTTVSYLKKWLEEREKRTKYNDSNRIWLTRRANPYSSRSLNRLLNRLLETAEIERDNIIWYSIRHSTGTYMMREEGLAAAQAQLRHKSEQTTMRYDQAPVEDRQDALSRMG